MDPTASDLPNPYRMAVVPDAWQPGESDVQSIHARAFQQCTRALGAVRARGRNHGVLVLGEPGSGKTHLLSRLRRYCLGDGSKPVDPILPEAVFVNIKPAGGPQQIWRSIRREFVADLLRAGPDERDQLQRVLLHRFAELRPADADLNLWWEWLKLLDPQPAAFESVVDSLLDRLSVQERMGRDLTVVLSHLLLNRNGRDARAWLRGDPLPETALAGLGLGQPDLDLTPEDQAREVVTSLCRLAGPKIPIVFAFDQIEALQLERRDTSGYFAFGQAIMDLFSRATNLLVVSCVQSGRIQEVEDGMLQPAYERMAMSQAALNSLLWPEAEALIQARDHAVPELAAHRRANGLPAFWPLDLDRLKQAVAQGRTPRKLLGECAQMFDGANLAGGPAASLPLTDYLTNQFDQRREQAVAQTGFERSGEVIGSVLPQLVELTQGSTWQRIKEPVPGLRPEDTVGVWASPDGRVAVHVSDAMDMRSAWRPLERLRGALERGKLEKVVIVRDARCALRGDATRERLDALRASGSPYLRPTPELLAALDALRTLLADAQSGDLSRDGESISLSAVRQWLERHMPVPVRDMIDELFAYPGLESPEIDDLEELADRLADELERCPVLAVDRLVEALGRPAELLGRCAERFPERFGTLAGPPAVFFRRVATGVPESEGMSRAAY